MKKYKYLVALFFTLVITGVSVYLAYNHYNALLVPCSATGGCETVLNSKYSVLLGVPLPYLGVAFSLGALTLTILSWIEPRFRRWFSIYAGFGALGALSFILLQLLVIHAICQYCMAVDLTSIVLFLWLVNVPDPEIAPKTSVVV